MKDRKEQSEQGVRKGLFVPDPPAVAVTQDETVQHVLDTAVESGTLLALLVSKWRKEKADLLDLERQLEVAKQQVRQLEITFQKGVGLLCGIESCLKTTFEAQTCEAQPKEKTTDVLELTHGDT